MKKKHEENPIVIKLLLLIQIAKRNFQRYQFTKKCGKVPDGTVWRLPSFW